MPSPVLSERTWDKAAADGDGYAAPERPTWAAPNPATAAGAGPITRTFDGAMTVAGTVTATGAMLALLLVTGAIGWGTTGATGTLSGWIIVAVIGALVTALVTTRKPKLARFTGPLYALLEGYAVGSISRVYDNAYKGIVLQAVGATIAVFAVMLFLYATRIIKVTDKFRRIVVGATMGVMVFYGISLLFSLFGHTPSFLHDASGLGIGLSLVVSGIAAFNLALNFDVIERGVKMQSPSYMEWYAGFGLLVTLVWLYLELLRLLSRLRER